MSISKTWSFLYPLPHIVFTSMIKSVLTLLVPIFDAKLFRPVNELVRWTYKFAVAPMIQWTFLPPKNADRVVFKLRHSASTGTNFNALISDLDFDVVAGALNEDILNKIRKHLLRWKFVIPSIGEYEIYERSEYLELTNNLSESGEIYRYLRNFRKVQWMKEAELAATTEYHRRKARRARENTQSALRSSFENFLRKHFPQVAESPEVPADASVDFESSYFNLRITGNPSAAHDSLYLPENLPLVLAACTPTYVHKEHKLFSSIENMRKEKEIQRSWSNLSKIEYLILRANLRTLPSAPSWAPERLAWLFRYGFQLKS